MIADGRSERLSDEKGLSEFGTERGIRRDIQDDPMLRHEPMVKGQGSACRLLGILNSVPRPVVQAISRHRYLVIPAESFPSPRTPFTATILEACLTPSGEW